MPGKRHTSLTAKRLAFAREYVKDSNGTQAAIRAGFSVKSAKCIASQLLRDPLVCGEVLRRTRAISVKTDVTAEKVLRELAKVGFANLADMVRVEVRRLGKAEMTELRILPTDVLTPDQRAAIAEISETENGIRIKLHDKTKALELLGKYLALFTDRTEVTGADGGPLVVVQAPKPPA